MMVTFISQCEKKALTRTRKVLDAFADRIGSNTWQTVITQEGLLAVKKSLRKTASRNTAVSCHWIRSRSRSELVWIVGQRGKFNERGVVPVNVTQANLLKLDIENNWQYLPLIKALVALAALLHDWGKASGLFQKKLDPSNKQLFKGDPVRHEWVSCLLLRAFIEGSQQSSESLSDGDWLRALAKGDVNEPSLLQHLKSKSGQPFLNLPPIAKLISWLIVSHHRLPLLEDEGLKAESQKSIDGVLALMTQQWGYENRYDEEEYQARIQQCFNFPNGLISSSNPWLKEIKKWSQRLLDCENLALKALEDGSYRLILTQARLCLMLGDHYYSSQDTAKNWEGDKTLFANTDRKTQDLKQKLDEHLVGVAKQGLRNAHLLPAFETELPVAKDIAALKTLSPKDYRWQDKAVSAIKEYSSNNKNSEGFFVVNMASTGCGKTFANAKVMRALSGDGDSLRFVLALGLRTLTMQTGDEYRDRVGLDDSELAVLIGSRAVMELHQQQKIDEQKDSYENTGSLSQEPLLDEEVDYDCEIPEEGLATVLTCQRDKKFLYAPVLACTIDHMMAATETKRGGRYILPTLRLMSSDLVIDEIDDFTGNDLIAIGRLIHLAGMLGRKVMISSATIPPDMAEGYFKAYRDGWRIHCNARDANTTIACAWIDEFNTTISNNSASELKDAILTYREQHQQFIEGRAKKLAEQPVKRKGVVASCESLLAEYTTGHNDPSVIQNKQVAYFDIALQHAIERHQNNHKVDDQTALAVSFGVVRVANINPCVALTRYLLNAEYPEGIELRVMAYHSQQVLLMRHEQEQHLDQVLKRKEKSGQQPEAFSNPLIRQHLQTIKQSNAQIKHVLFIVVATPVEEVGRDHDFDWGVVEPSSYRSIVQLAGRVRRHRKSEALHANVSLLQYNWKGIRDKHKEKSQVFQKPGFEEKGMYLASHDLNDLVDVDEIVQRLDAIPRIQKSQPLKHTERLADLEHYVTKQLIANFKTVNQQPVQTGPANLQGYLNEPWFLTALPPHFTPFREGQPNIKLFLVFDEDGEQLVFCEKNEKGVAIPREKIMNIGKFVLTSNERQRLWLIRDFEHSIEQKADEQDSSKRRISLRYGEISFPYKEGSGYEYSDQLGLVEKESPP